MYGWKKALIWLSGVLLIAALLACAGGQPDPEPSGGPVRMSHESGFYNDPFMLAMDCDAGEIRYTLDGSEPDEHSLLYTGPILIDDASSHENVYSARTDVSLDLNPDILAAEGQEPLFGIKVPSRPVDKATVVRAVCIDRLGKRSSAQDAVFFVGFDEKDAYEGIPVMSITTDPKGLFDNDDGIYVLGKTFYRTSIDSLDRTAREHYRFWPANYMNRGRLWEREAAITLFDSERKPVFSGRFGIRVQGRGGRGLLPKGLNLYARDSYGTSGFPGKALFGLDCDLNRLNLNSGNDDMNTLLKDYLVNCLAADLNVGTRPYIPCAMFLDGEYWGVYWLTPRYKEDYFAGVYHIPADNLIEVKHNSKKFMTEVGDASDADLYQAIFDWVAQTDMSATKAYERLCEQIDMDSYIDYCAVELYIANTDWPNNNVAAWRTREKADQPLADTLWRWLLFDVNLSMSKRRAETDLIQYAACRDAMFCSLLDNKAFVGRLKSRMAALARETFEPSRVEAFIRDYEQMMGSAMAYSFVRFRDGDRTEQDFIDDCEATNLFFANRAAYILKKYG